MVRAPARLRVAFDAHVVGRRRTGNERYAVELASALAQRADVDLVAYVDRGRRWPDVPPAPRLHELRMRWPQLRIPLELPIRARRDGAHVLHVQYAPPPVPGVPVVTAIHDISFEDLPSVFPMRTRLRLRAAMRVALSVSAAVVVLSRFTRDRVIARYGFDPARIHVTPPGVRIAPEASLDEPMPGGLPADYVLAVGDLHPRKNVPRLVRAVARARRHGVGDLALVLAGSSGWHGGELDAAVEEVGGRAWVQRLGHVPDVVLDRLYRRARVVCHPSLYEGFGFPVLEALARGAVVVASSTTAMPEAAGDAALLVDPTNEPALADAIGMAASDPALRRRLADAGPRHAAAFSWAATAEATVGAYRAAIER